MQKLSTTTAVLLTLIALVLSACGASNETKQTGHQQTESETSTETETTEAPTASLEGEPWNLTSLNGADLIQNTELFIAFTEERVSGSAGCNRYMGSYTSSNSEITLSRIALTRRACIAQEVGQQEMEYSRILNDVTSFQISENRLELSTPQGETLIYRRAQAEESEQDDAETLIVGPSKVHCVGVGPMQCLQTKASAEDSWQMMYSPIEGFTHQDGVTSVLKVRRVQVDNPPADRSSIRTVLVEIVSQEPASN